MCRKHRERERRGQEEEEMERRSCYSKKLLNMYHKSRSPHFWFSVQLFVVLQMGAAVLGQISNEALALLALKSSINDPGGHLENWVQQQQGGNGGVSTSPCTWTGITCNSNMSSVISLNLSTMNLSGSVSGDLGNLPNLLNISLDCNNFTGELPPQILSLSALQYFNISNNNFSNPFLSNFSQLQNLQVGSGSVGTRRSKCLSVSFRPSFLPFLCVHVCVFVSVWILYFFVFLGRDKDTIILSQFSWANKISQNFLALLLLRFYYFWMSSSTYFFGFVCLFVLHLQILAWNWVWDLVLYCYFLSLTFMDCLRASPLGCLPAVCLCCLCTFFLGPLKMDCFVQDLPIFLLFL